MTTTTEPKAESPHDRQARALRAAAHLVKKIGRVCPEVKPYISAGHSNWQAHIDMPIDIAEIAPLAKALHLTFHAKPGASEDHTGKVHVNTEFERNDVHFRMSAVTSDPAEMAEMLRLYGTPTTEGTRDDRQA